MRRLRVYLDASVYGGCFDAPFREDSMRVIDAVRRGRLEILASEIVLAELGDAPKRVRELAGSLPPESLEEVPLSSEILELRDAYIAAGILGPGQRADATHVAAATVARADAIVSWNFRHIVRLDKIKGYNQVNLQHGYGILTVVSPKEVNVDEPEEAQ